MFFFLSPDKTDENPREGEQFSLELGHDGFRKICNFLFVICTTKNSIQTLKCEILELGS